MPDLIPEKIAPPIHGLWWRTHRGCRDRGWNTPVPRKCSAGGVLSGCGEVFNMWKSTGGPQHLIAFMFLQFHTDNSAKSTMHYHRRSSSTSHRRSSTVFVFSCTDGLKPTRQRTMQAVRRSKCTNIITEWADGSSVTNVDAEKRNAAGIFPAVLVQMQSNANGNLTY